MAVPPATTWMCSHIVGYIAVIEEGKLVGFNVTVGGGMGARREESTFPRLADVMGFMRRAGRGSSEAVVKVQRDHGCRTERARAFQVYWTTTGWTGFASSGIAPTSKSAST